jgi:hypothetical protein
VILPAVLVFGLGLACTVAPLTATVLGSVQAGHSGLASGANNAVSRIASLLAIAAVGAVVSAAFTARLEHNLRGKSGANAIIQTARTRPLVTSGPATVHPALVDASVHAFRIGMELAAGLAMLGGLVSLVGIENPRIRTPPTL